MHMKTRNRANIPEALGQRNESWICSEDLEGRGTRRIDETFHVRFRVSHLHCSWEALLDGGGVTGDTEHSKVVVSHRNYEDLGWKDT